MMRDVVISIMATLAEQERITISERTKAGLARTRKAGTRLGRRPAQVDMAAVEKRHADGESLRGIARSLKVSPALLIKRRKAACYSETDPDTAIKLPPYPQAVAAGALEIFVFGNHRVTALLADMPTRTLQHRLVPIAQHAIWTTNDWVSH